MPTNHEPKTYMKTEGDIMVTDLKTKEPCCQRGRACNVQLFGSGLNFKVSKGNVLTLSPPLIITEDELSKALDCRCRDVYTNCCDEYYRSYRVRAQFE
ncbi:hypothetical protein [Paenibacillus alginolyticus]|uniref:Uncharacterized protein n=1 Tax=Paenibacillus alginolyticus TaxID=59839 RepID=A0ABT4G6R7_9BACL|nr:hypothetical protein [Paenibacillus alginolyticus]MCY9691873.1 hypothetical protein [Paenibacillus alginolyticus]MEC0144597.1 hypothetical protein [Paenibacillus alginolyticus]